MVSRGGTQAHEGGRGDVVEFRILGPLELTDAGQPVNLNAGKLRRLLAVLLCRAGAVLSTEQLAAALSGSAGEVSRKAVQIQVHRLRRALGEGNPIAYRPPGYTLTLTPGALDAHRFEELTEQGRKALAAGDHRRAGDLLREGLALWRGQALAGLHDVPVLREHAARLTELRLAATHDRIDAELGLGRHIELVAELTPLVAAHPVREDLRRQLILALYRSGRQAEALEVYREGRRVLVDELGIEPGPELRRLEHAILAADPALDYQPAPAGGGIPREVPAQLPPDIADFVGRETVVATLRAELVPSPAGEPPAAMAVSTVAGRGGVGKTTVAVHVAHHLSPVFVDGQLYLNLAGTTAEPADPVRVLARLLRALGVDGSAIPEGLDERAELYRQRLAGRRILVVLDDAAHEAQVRPLLPGSPTCAVLVTSRVRLAGLSGSRRTDLDGFDAAGAIELLGRLAGAQRVAKEPTAAAEIARLCGYLPLAVRIAGARLAARPHWPVASLAHRLTDARRRLDVLATGDLAVRACFALSYHALSPAAQTAFRLLGTLDVPDFAAWAASAVLDVDEHDGESLVETLVDAQLLDAGPVDATGRTRYRFHDLVRVFARERAEAEEDPPALAAAFARAGGAWLALAEAAGRRLPAQTLADIVGTASRWRPGAGTVDALLADAVAWFDAEHHALLAVIGQAARTGLAELAWELAQSAQGYYELRDLYDEGQHAHRLAVEVCRRAGNERGQAVLLRNLASLWTSKPGSSREQRRDHAESALALFQRLGERAGEVDALYLCGDSHRVGGDYPAALTALQEAVSVARAIGYRIGELHGRQQICAIHREQGRYATAAEHAERCVALARELCSSRDQAVSLMLLGIIRREQDDLPGSESCFRQGIEVSTAAGDPAQTTYLYAHLGQLYAKHGHPAARATLDRAEQLSRAHSLTFGLANALHGLGDLDHADGRLDLAVQRLGEAAALWHRLGHAFAQARTLKRLGGVYAARGEPESAEETWRRARALYAELGNAMEVEELDTLIGDAGP